MQWQIKQKAPEEFQKQFPEYLPVVSQLLYDRELTDTHKIREFFNVDYETSSHDPFLMLGMKEACERIWEAVKKEEKIMVVGDYDADGVCGLTILSEVIRGMGAKNLDTYIPDRESEGYGLNLGIVEKIAKERYDLVLTIDCGISDKEEIDFLRSKGVQTIVVDHHIVPEVLPSADIIINPKQKNDTYPFKNLCATGLAFKLAQSLYGGDNTKIPGTEKWLLDLVAIATVADVMPLQDENRVFVKYGLYVLSKTRRIGLKELMNVARIKPEVIDSDILATNLNTHTLGFQIAPRINVASRMDHANTAYQLLITSSVGNARQLAEGLEKKNKERQAITEKIIKEIESRGNLVEQKVIFEYGEKWPAGVMGIIAGKLAERYYLPAFVLSKKEKVSVGSARSIPPLNITAAIASAKGLLEEYGGHHQAAGLTVKNENLEVFKEHLREYVGASLTPNDLIPVLSIDYELTPQDITWALYDELEKFAPFGEANPRPKFLMKNLTVKNISMVGNGGSHLKLILSDTGSERPKILKAIGFGLGSWTQRIAIKDTIDVVAELIINEWNGNRELQLKIIDLRKTGVEAYQQ